MALFVKKEKMKSLIFCEDHDFHQKTVATLNMAAFGSEKVGATTVEEGVGHLKRDQYIRNVVIDGTKGAGLALMESKSNFKKIYDAQDCIFLIYVKDDQAINSYTQFYADLPGLNFLKLPMTKGDFIKVFHTRKKGEVAPEAAPPPPPSKKAAAPEKPKEPEAPPPPISILEASQHVKNTIEKINQIEKDRSLIKEVLAVGQIFNGIIGAFPYLEKKDGYKQIRQLAEIIDNLSRTYQAKPEIKEISSSHFDLLKESARLAYLFLKTLRENAAIPPDLTESLQKTLAVHEQAGDIVKRKVESQEDVDKLIDELVA